MRTWPRLDRICVCACGVVIISGDDTAGTGGLSIGVAVCVNIGSSRGGRERIIIMIERIENVTHVDIR